MKSFKIALIATTFALAGGLATVSYAEDASTTGKSMVTKGVKAPKAPKGPEKPRTEASKACSVKATAQGLHGKPRKTFMKTCKKGAAPM